MKSSEKTSSSPTKRFSFSSGTASPSARRASISSTSTPSPNAAVASRRASPGSVGRRRSGSDTQSIISETSTPSRIRPSSPAPRRSSLKSPTKLIATDAPLKVSESVEQAIARLELEMPSDAYLSRSKNLSNSVAALGQPSIPVRSTSPYAPRPVIETTIAFGRHQSPPRERPPSPPRAARTNFGFTRADGQPACENGCQRAATHWCDKCEVEMCAICDSAIHGSNAALKNHPRVLLSDRLQLCPVHRESCKLFCSECTSTICQQCVPTSTHKFPDGRGHPIFDIDAAATARRPEIAEMAAQLDALAISAPQTLRHLQVTEALVQEKIDCVGVRLKSAVDDFQRRLQGDLRKYMEGDMDQMERYIASTEAARNRITLDAEVARKMCSEETPPQAFLSNWRDLRSSMIDGLKEGLGQAAPSVKMNVDLTGQVMAGKIMTLEMELQRVLDALDKCGQVVNVPRNGTSHIIALHPKSP